MVPAKPIGIEQWLSRREMFATAVAAWAGGFALAAVAGWHVQSRVMPSHAADETSASDNAQSSCDGVSTDTSSSQGSAGTNDSAGAVFLPEDAIVASRTPRGGGATQMQRP